jgi:hypothetical protein
MSARGYPMRDLMFMLAPVALIVYFVVYPDQFSRSSGGRDGYFTRSHRADGCWLGTRTGV